MVDDPRVAARLAIRLLDGGGGDPGDGEVDEAIRLLEGALALAGEHSDAALWWWYLAGAYDMRAADDASPHALRRAAECLHRALTSPPDPSIDLDHVVVDLALHHFQLLDTDVEDDLDTLVAELDGVPVPGPAAFGGQAVQLYRGMARLVRRRGSDVLEGVQLLGEVLGTVPDDLPLLAEALLGYAEASTDLGETAQALDVLGRTRQLLDPADIEGAAELDLLEARARHERWLRDDDPQDRDLAIECLERAAAIVHGRPDAQHRHGELLAMRGADRSSVADLTAGIALLLAAADADPAGDATIPYAVACAYRTRWELARNQADRESAVSAYGAALEQGLDGELELDAHHWRVSLTGELLATCGGDREVTLATGVAHDASAALAALGPDCDPADRALLAGVLVGLRHELGKLDPSTVDTARTATEVAIARTLPEPPPGWHDALDAAAATVIAIRDLRSGSATSIDPTPYAGGAPGSRSEMSALFGVVLAARSTTEGDLAGMGTAREVLDGSDAPEAAWVAAWVEIMAAASSGAGPAELASAVDRLTALVAEAAADPADRWVREQLLPFVRTLQAASRGEAVPLPPLPVPAPAAPTGSAHRATVTTFTALSAAMTVVVAPGTPLPERLRALATAAAHAESLPRGETARGLAAGLLATGHVSLLRALPSTDLADAGLAWADEALQVLGGPEHPLWASAALAAAEIHRNRRAPDALARSRECGLAALRGRAWLVLLQTGTAHGLAAARSAAQEALQVARWCAQDRHREPGALDDLVAALDAGRGLVLHAAAVTRTVPDLLTALGERALAEEWERTDGADRIDLGLIAAGVDLHGDLRRRVLTVLSRGSADLLEPPETDTIRAVLDRHRSDALVYLVPSAGSGLPGLAVAVPAAGPVDVVELPELAGGPGSALDAYATAFARWHGPDHGGPEARRAAFEEWRSRLGELTTWAWRAAAGPLLDAAARWGAREDVPRLVLCPVGSLALVPWHAARPEGGAPSTVLGARAVISATPSARLLERTLARPAAAGTGALVVGDPTGDLRSAGAEAHAVHAVFHPEATYLGRAPARGNRQPTGAGSTAEVLEWLTGHADGGLLHLACHAVAEVTDPTRSRLRLADGDLTVEDLLARTGSTRLHVERIVLSACATNVSGADYDEAFSIATAFLAAGARTAFGSMWTVPDAYTSRLVFMVHHFLRSGHSPAEALHHARRWALDPDRTPPSTMPAELVAARSALPSDDPVAWAGLMHLGA